MEIRLDKIAYRYRNKKVFEGLSTSFFSGKLTALLGENGSGKTTMLKLMVKALKPHSGHIFIGKEDFNYIPRRDSSKLIGYVSQSYEIPYLNVFDYLLIGRTPYQNFRYSKSDEEIVCKVIEETGLKGFEGRMLSEMSGGEKKKVIIARALVQQPKIILLDEPTNNLDMKNQLDIMRIIKRESLKNSVTSVLSVHDVNLAIRFADRFILLKDGEILDAGGREVLTADKLSLVYGTPLRVYEQEGTPVVTYEPEDDMRF